MTPHIPPSERILRDCLDECKKYFQKQKEVTFSSSIEEQYQIVIEKIDQAVKRAAEVDNWLDIEQAPKDRAIWVAWRPVSIESDWYTPWLFAWAKWDGQEFKTFDRIGWEDQVAMYWQPLPAPPKEAT